MLPRDRLHRTLVINWLAGMGIGVLFALALFVLNTAQLGHLILGDDEGHVALFLLIGGFAFMCGGVLAATAIMSEASYKDDPNAL